MRKAGYILLVLCCTLLAACKQKRESEHVLKGKRTEALQRINTLDTNQVVDLIVEGNNLFKTNQDSASLLYKEAIKRAQVINFKQGTARAAHNLYALNLSQKNFPKAAQYLDYSLKYYSLLGRSDRLIPLYPELSTLQFMQENYTKVISTYHTAAPWYDLQKKQEQQLLLKLKYNKAIAHLYLAQYDSTSADLLYILNEIGVVDSANYQTLSAAYIGLGLLNISLGNSTKALTYFDKGEILAERFADTMTLCQIYGNKGSAYYNQDKLQEAKRYAERGLAIAKKLGNAQEQFISAQIMAGCKMKEGLPEQALPYNTLALTLANQRNSVRDQIMAYLQLGTNYKLLHRYKEAEDLLKHALQVAQENGVIEKLGSIYVVLSEVYAGMGKFELAYNLRGHYQHMKDSLASNEQVSRITTLESENKLIQKDRALLLQTMELDRQHHRQYIWLAGAGLLVLLMLGILLYLKHKIAITKLKAVLEGEEQERMRMGRELHDGIVSQLSVLKTNLTALPFIHQEDQVIGYQKAIEQLDMGILGLRNTSHNLLPDNLKLIGLEQTLHDYCKKISQSGALQVAFQLVGSLPLLRDDFTLNIYRIAQELINNIIKHAQASFVLVQFNANTEELNVTIDDNGNGIVAKHNGTSSGLHNIHSRMQLLGGTMETEVSAGVGTSVYLNFNLKRFVLSS